jgi:mannose-6-phosphate isomerase-like protein (cupin superfamily)
VLDVLGPAIEFLRSPAEKDAAYCVMRGVIPPGVSVPLHSHPDPETFFIVSGSGQALVEREDGLHGSTSSRAGSCTFPATQIIEITALSD